MKCNGKYVNVSTDTKQYNSRLI